LLAAEIAEVNIADYTDFASLAAEPIHGPTKVANSLAERLVTHK
jgi:hypothetical protein